MEARQRQAAYVAVAEPVRPGAYTPPRNWKWPKVRPARKEGYNMSALNRLIQKARGR